MRQRFKKFLMLFQKQFVGDIMANIWTMQPYMIIAELLGVGCEAQLILYVPNSKNIDDIKNVEFYSRFKDLEYQKIDNEMLETLLALQHEIEIYCESEMFVTYECAPALELYVHDFRDNIIKCMCR